VNPRRHSGLSACLNNSAFMWLRVACSTMMLIAESSARADYHTLQGVRQFGQRRCSLWLGEKVYIMWHVRTPSRSILIAPLWERQQPSSCTQDSAKISSVPQVPSLFRGVQQYSQGSGRDEMHNA